MMNSFWSQHVADAMNCLGGEFRENELAYLALTSKVENPIRDRLAYALHRNITEEKGFYCTREWTTPRRKKKDKSVRGGRIDLTIFENRNPRLLVELKSLYSFDMYKKDRDTLYPCQVAKDMKKMNNYDSDHEIERIAIILITDPVQNPDKHLEHVIKYNRYIRQFHERTKSGLETAVAYYFRNFRSFSCGRIDGGRAFGIDVSVRYWCFDSYKPAAAS